MSEIKCVKRKRDPAFQSSEKLLLIDLVESHYSVVESKKTDVVNVRARNEEWIKITEKFNSSSDNHPRDWQVLKNCWENMKKKAKAKLTQQNQNFLATGGGPPKKFPDDPVIEHVVELIKPTVTGFINSYDSDGNLVIGSSQITSGELSQITLTKDDKQDSDSDTQDQIFCNTDGTLTNDTQDWSQYSVSMLRTPTNPILCMTNYTEPSQEQQIASNEQFIASAPVCSTTRAQTVVTPVRPTLSNRRRPVLKNSDSLTQNRINLLLDTNAQAKEEHEVQMRLLKLEEEVKKEMLKQEKIKSEQEQIRLEILKEELRRIKEK